MAARMYPQANSGRMLRRAPAAIGRWSRDMRAPALRLTPPPAPELEKTAPIPIVAPAITQTNGTALATQRSNTIADLFAPHPSPVIQLRVVQARSAMPFLGRESACPYLECRSSGRRCLSADPAQVSLERQVRHCLSADHRQCKYYRKARGLPAVPPNHAAMFTVAAVVLLVIAAYATL